MPLIDDVLVLLSGRSSSNDDIGDSNTIEVTITADGSTDTTVEPWPDTWTASLDF